MRRCPLNPEVNCREKEELIPTDLSTVNDFALNTSSLETVLYQVNGSHLSVSSPDPGDMETVSAQLEDIVTCALHVGCLCLHVYICTYVCTAVVYSACYVLSVYVRTYVRIYILCTSLYVCTYVCVYVCTYVLYCVGDVMHLRTYAQVEGKYLYVVCNVYITNLFSPLCFLNGLPGTLGLHLVYVRTYVLVCE